jgi:putative salt-induced outer membrane protein
MKTNIFIIAAAAALIANAGFAQTTTFDNADRTSDAVDDLQELIEDDAERDTFAFGTEGREVGAYGSLSLRGTSTSDDGETSSDLGVGLRYGTFDGVNGIDVTANFVYGESDGVETDNQLLAGADYRRNFGEAFFGFAKADLAFDRLADEDGETTQDVFLGAGVGYRIFNDNVSQWSIQAGPGYRIADVVGEERVEEAAAAVSSNYFRSLSDTSYVTNDTDVIYSEFSTTMSNELALNVAVTDQMVLRTSLATSFDDSTDEEFGDATNTFGVSVVYNFN